MEIKVGEVVEVSIPEDLGERVEKLSEQLAFEIESATRRIYSADGSLKSLEVIHFDDDGNALPAITIPVSRDVGSVG